MFLTLTVVFCCNLFDPDFEIWRVIKCDRVPVVAWLDLNQHSRHSTSLVLMKLFGETNNDPPSESASLSS